MAGAKGQKYLYIQKDLLILISLYKERERAMTREEKIEVIRAAGGDKEHILGILLELQSRSDLSYIDEETAQLVADELGLALTKVYEVLTFYAMLETKPSAKYILEVCNSTPCYYSKADEVVAMVKNAIGIGVGETTKDQMFTLRYTPCVGACEIGPVIKVGDRVYGNLTQEKVTELIEQLKG
jgi:NADH-quinone oxidoreductase subunit E